MQCRKNGPVQWRQFLPAGGRGRRCSDSSTVDPRSSPSVGGASQSAAFESFSQLLVRLRSQSCGWPRNGWKTPRRAGGKRSSLFWFSLFSVLSAPLFCLLFFFCCLFSMPCGWYSVVTRRGTCACQRPPARQMDSLSSRVMPSR